MLFCKPLCGVYHHCVPGFLWCLLGVILRNCFLLDFCIWMRVELTGNSGSARGAEAQVLLPCCPAFLSQFLFVTQGPQSECLEVTGCFCWVQRHSVQSSGVSCWLLWDTVLPLPSKGACWLSASVEPLNAGSLGGLWQRNLYPGWCQSLEYHSHEWDTVSASELLLPVVVNHGCPLPSAETSEEWGYLSTWLLSRTVGTVGASSTVGSL